jgi:hypothetical protein
MKDFLKVLSIFVVAMAVLVVLALGIKMLFFPVHVVEQSIDMTNGVIDKSLNSENAIYNYEWFKRQEESIQSLYKKEVRAKQTLEDFRNMLPETRENWTRDDKTEYDRLNTIVQGLGNQIDDAIAEYNARSNMVNRNIFKDNLPTNLNRSFFEALELTK